VLYMSRYFTAHNKFIKYRYGQKTAFTGRAKNARHL
jgi:hypothetical protein